VRDEFDLVERRAVTVRPAEIGQRGTERLLSLDEHLKKARADLL
jgi:hypothetical protein